jgi:hypothetical protein
MDRLILFPSAGAAFGSDADEAEPSWLPNANRAWGLHGDARKFEAVRRIPIGGECRHTLMKGAWRKCASAPTEHPSSTTQSTKLCISCKKLSLKINLRRALLRSGLMDGV